MALGLVRSIFGWKALIAVGGIWFLLQSPETSTWIQGLLWDAAKWAAILVVAALLMLLAAGAVWKLVVWLFAPAPVARWWSGRQRPQVAKPAQVPSEDALVEPLVRLGYKVVEARRRVARARTLGYSEDETLRAVLSGDAR